MKKFYFLSFVSLISLSVFAQAPQGFNYQAAARDAQGNILEDQSLMVRITIYAGENAVWSEDHSAITNRQGIFSLVIGDPSASGSGSAGTFNEISWGTGEHSLGIEIDTGDGYVDMGTTPFQSVPYALYAANADSGSGTGSEWDLQQDTLSTLKYVGIGTSNTSGTSLAVQGLNTGTETPLFEVRREDGMPVFAVFNDGVMVYVDEEQKGIKGGFAVGGYNASEKGVSQEYLRVTKDSVRIYVPEDLDAKGRKGGFAIGGYNASKEGNSQDLMFVTPDSIRLYVPNKENDPGYVGLQGGFAVETFDPEALEGQPREYIMGMNRGITRFNTADNRNGFAIGSQGEGWSSTYMQVTPVNTFVGFESGANTRNDPDAWNSNQGARNVFLGYKAGQSNTYGNHNVFLGYQSGLLMEGDSLDEIQGAFNVLIGPNSGRDLTDGWSNVFIGENAGSEATSSFGNIFIGSYAGSYTSAGGGNVVLGEYAGRYLNQSNNVIIGSAAGNQTVDGNNNVFIGANAGSNANGSRNIFIGNNAGYNEDGSDLLYIDNSSTDTPLIWGDLSADQLRMNASVGINSATGENRLTVVETRSNYGPAAIYGRNESGTNGRGIGVQGTGGLTGVLAVAFTSGTGSRFGLESYAYNGEYNYGIYAYGAGGIESHAIYASGSIAHTGAIISASDQKFKEDVQSLGSVMENLMKVTPRSYDIKDGTELKSYGMKPQSQYGFVAQELEEVFPELVVDVTHPSQRDPQSKDFESGSAETYKGVKYMEMIPILLKGMQEQQEEIERLRAEIEALKNQ